MSFFFEHRTLRSGNSHNLKTCRRMYAHKEQSTEVQSAKRNDEAGTECFPSSIGEKIKANLEPLNAQNSTLTQVMNKLIQDNSANLNPTAGPRDLQSPSESPFTGGPAISRFPPLESLMIAGYSPNILLLEVCIVADAGYTTIIVYSKCFANPGKTRKMLGLGSQLKQKVSMLEIIQHPEVFTPKSFSVLF